MQQSNYPPPPSPPFFLSAVRRGAKTQQKGTGWHTNTVQTRLVAVAVGRGWGWGFKTRQQCKWPDIWCVPNRLFLQQILNTLKARCAFAPRGMRKCSVLFAHSKLVRQNREWNGGHFAASKNTHDAVSWLADITIHIVAVVEHITQALMLRRAPGLRVINWHLYSLFRLFAIKKVVVLEEETKNVITATN